MEQTFNKIVDILYLAKQDGVEFIVNGEKLQLKVAGDKSVDKGLLEEIKKHKLSIIDYLNDEQWKSKKVNGKANWITRFDRSIVLEVPLSFSQERLLFIDKLERGERYFAVLPMRLKGILNKNALNFALKTIVERHEILRTIYNVNDGYSYQVLKDADSWKLNTVVLESDQQLNEVIANNALISFNLSVDYMLRATLIVVGETEHVLVVTMHHIASDAWSIPIIIKEVAELYSSVLENREPRLAALTLQYSDFAVWQRNYLQGEVLQNKLAYWKEQLQGIMPLQLPTDYPRPAVKTSRGASTFTTVDKATASGISELSRQQGGSLYMTLLAAFKVLLYRYSGQQDISVGTSIANRTQQEIEGLVGFFVNTLTLRTQVQAENTFIELLQQVKVTTMGAYEHQDVPFEKVVETVLKERDASRSPLFQVMLVLLNTPDAPKLKLGQLELSSEPVENTSAKFDITLFVTEVANGLRISAEYNTDLYGKETIGRMLNQYSTLLKSIVADPQQKVGMLPLLSQQEHQQLLQFGQNKVDYATDSNIIALFEAQVQHRPQQTAIIYEDQKLSYSELNERANQLAHYLRSKGVQTDSLVPLCIDSGLDMMIGMLGILKAGGAYVPIDTSFPADRISFLLKDINATVVVTSSQSRNKIEVAAEEDLVITETDNLTVSLQPKNNPGSIPGSSHLAYVIYTSGSTGRPKGVMITHSSVNDYVAGLSQKLPIGQCHSYALVSTLATDLGNTVIYSSLLKGGALHLFSKAQVSNIDYLHIYFGQHKIDCLKIVPGHWKALALDRQPLLPEKLLIFGGEALPASIVNQLQHQAPQCMVVNHYGPTETTIGKLLYVVGHGDANAADAKISEPRSNTIPIGKPFGNTNVYVLSAQKQLSPIGVPGQLYIAGHGLAKGYHNNTILTGEKFVKNPFKIENVDEKVDRSNAAAMYATGDLVRYLSDGNIEFLGRVDDQVKIRGYRVELGEIENTIRQYDGIDQAVVMAPEDKQGNKKVVAYIVAREGVSKELLTAYLKDKLPDYMVPAIIIKLESLPLTANGKVNKKALPDADMQQQPQKGFVAAQNEEQQKLVSIWQDILETDPIGIHDDFFELGGHSLLAVRLISAIRKQFKAEIPISHIFDYPTIALLEPQLLGSGITEGKEEKKINYKSLVPIKAGNNKTPFYIVCGTGGTAFTFKKFAELLDPNQSVFGLQQPDTQEEFDDFPDTIEGIAAKYLKEVLTQNPEGPYFLAGHCVGGVIAFEMAKQLQALGKNVQLLALLDTLVITRQKPSDTSKEIGNRFSANFKHFFSTLSLKIKFETFLFTKHPLQAIEYKLGKFKSLMKRKILNKSVKETTGLEVFNEFSVLYRKALSKYEITKFDGEILAFYAKDHYYFLDREKNIGYRKYYLSEKDKNFWRNYADKTTVYEIEGEHSMIFDPVNAQRFAEILRENLKYEIDKNPTL